MTSRSRSVKRSRSAVVNPGLRARSRSDCWAYLRIVSAKQPIFAAIDPIAAHCDACSASERQGGFVSPLRLAFSTVLGESFDAPMGPTYLSAKVTSSQ